MTKTLALLCMQAHSYVFDGTIKNTIQLSIPYDRRGIGLIERAKQKDEQAFLALIQRYMPVIRKVIAKYIRRIAGYEEDDIVKMVVLYAWEKIPDLRGGEDAFRCLLRQKTNWVCLDLLQKQKKEGNPISIDNLSDYHQVYPHDPNPGTLEMLLAKEKKQLFREALDALPEPYKSTVSLRNQGLSHAEIAKSQNIAINTVGSRLNRGITYMKEILEKRGILDS
jgi:RNA polymerase sigma factor (sigma-70 family)